ncbi:MAG: DUF1634 domain-containing protein [Opitutales bacterium]|jgi:uncharacterized membrane protein
MKTRDPISVELVISEILRWGVRVSLGLILLGTALCFLRCNDYGVNGGTPEDLHALIANGASFPRTLGWLWSGLFALRGQAVLVAGLLLLISTPVLRVMAAIVAFSIHRDRAYVGISLLVFLLVVTAFALGAA